MLVTSPAAERLSAKKRRQVSGVNAAPAARLAAAQAPGVLWEDSRTRSIVPECATPGVRTIPAHRTDLLVGALAHDRLTPLDLAVAPGPDRCLHRHPLGLGHTIFCLRQGALFSGLQFSTESWICAAACAQPRQVNNY